MLRADRDGAHRRAVTQPVARGDCLGRTVHVGFAVSISVVDPERDRTNQILGVSQLRHRLDELMHGARSEELTQARAQWAAAAAQHDQASKEYQRQADLLGRGLVAQAQVDQQQQLRDTSAASVRSAQAGENARRAGQRALDLHGQRRAGLPKQIARATFDERFQNSD